jgi:hypothetical protein
MSEAAQALQGAIDLLRKFYESPSLAHTNALLLIDKELPVLRAALDDVEWTEKGLAEWRDRALANARHAEAARATARVAISHLQAILIQSRTCHQSLHAERLARDWLTSIGSEPT